MSHDLTDEEFSELNGATTAEAWADACNKVKAARGRDYPPDWYARIIAQGIPQKVAARFGGSAEIRLMVKSR
jgi:hypothetical protein